MHTRSHGIRQPTDLLRPAGPLHKCPPWCLNKLDVAAVVTAASCASCLWARLHGCCRKSRLVSACVLLTVLYLVVHTFTRYLRVLSGSIRRKMIRSACRCSATNSSSMARSTSCSSLSSLLAICLYTYSDTQHCSHTYSKLGIAHHLSAQLCSSQHCRHTLGLLFTVCLHMHNNYSTVITYGCKMAAACHLPVLDLQCHAACHTRSSLHAICLYYTVCNTLPALLVVCLYAGSFVTPCRIYTKTQQCSTSETLP